MTPNTPASAPKNPLRANTAFQRTAAALALNQLSDAMSLITITFMVIAMNGSPELASLVLFCCSFTAITAGIISGTIVDRMTPRRALILSCATQTLGWVGVLALSMSGSHSIVVLTLILVLLTAASQLDYPSEQKIIAATVPVTDLGRASAIKMIQQRWNKFLVVLEHPSVTRVGINHQGAVGNTLMHVLGQRGGNHAVIITIGN